MRKGFVFGKFLPFHRGHEAMMRFALTKCDLLTVLICCSNKEKISGETRGNWIKSIFLAEDKIELQVLNYDENKLTNSSESSREVSLQWANVFRQLLPDHALLVTSEPYGKFVAEFMEIEHIPFDPERKLNPVSSSAIRKDVLSNWKYLPSSVKYFYSLKVIILGTESTGKTTLSKQLTNHFKCECVEEAGRELIPDSRHFTLSDLNTVALEHGRRINESVEKNPLVIIDTDIHITKSYASFSLKQDLIVPKELYEANKGNLYLYLKNDVPYFQDGTRLSKEDRNKLDLCHREILKNYNISYIEINGNWDSRFEQAVKHIEKLIESRVFNVV